MEPIRIAHIIGKMNSGGVEAVVMNYYRHIDRTKIQFDFIVDADSTIPQREEIESLGGKIIVVPSYQKLPDYIKKLKNIFVENEYKIVHSHINVLSIFPLYAAKKADVPVRIAHSHSSAGKGEFKKNIVKYVLKHFSRIYATDFFACSEYAGRWLFGNRTFSAGKVSVIHNAIAIDKFVYNETIRNEVRKELKVENREVIGHIGRFVTQKNHSFLINIFYEMHKINTNTFLIFAGEGPLEIETKKKVEILGLQDSILFLGVRKDTCRLYQAFDLFLLPSLYEGLPVVGVEAQISGVPCLLSDKMTAETKILKTTVFKSLQETSKDWAKSALLCMQNKRVDITADSRDFGFDIQKEAPKLEKKYLSFYVDFEECDI